MPNKKVIDLSHWNVIPESLEAAKAAGVLGVIHKASEGGGGADDKYSARRFMAAEAGLLFGAYHFLRPGDMRTQARVFLELAAPDDAMLMAADHEDERVSLADLQIWLDEIEARTGRRAVIYSGHVLKDQLAGKSHPVINGDNYRLWLAQYGSSYKLPPGWASYWLWQWSQSESVPGITPPTDVNDWPGTAADLRAEWSGAKAIPEPPPAPTPEGQLSPTDFQAALAQAGFYAGEIDGVSGPLTRKAVDEWFEDGEPLDISMED